MFAIIRKMFIVLLTSIVNATNHAKCVSLSNHKCEIQSTLINLHSNEYSQITVKLGQCFGSCTTLNDLLNKVLLLFQIKQKV